MLLKAKWTIDKSLLTESLSVSHISKHFLLSDFANHRDTLVFSEPERNLCSALGEMKRKRHTKPREKIIGSLNLLPSDTKALHWKTWQSSILENSKWTKTTFPSFFLKGRIAQIGKDYNFSLTRLCYQAEISSFTLVQRRWMEFRLWCSVEKLTNFLFQMKIQNITNFQVFNCED